MARVPVLRNRGNGGVIVVVVLGVELELGGGSSSHCEGDCGEGILEEKSYEERPGNRSRSVRVGVELERGRYVMTLHVLAPNPQHLSTESEIIWTPYLASVIPSEPNDRNLTI